MLVCALPQRLFTQPTLQMLVANAPAMPLRGFSVREKPGAHDTIVAVVITLRTFRVETICQFPRKIVIFLIVRAHTGNCPKA